MLAFFAQQEDGIQAEIARLRETSEIMKLRASLAQEALAHAEGAYLLEERPRERIFLCPPPRTASAARRAQSLPTSMPPGRASIWANPAGVLITPDSTASGEPVWRYRPLF